MSALIHAATMVVAGVYLVARLYGVFWEGFSIEAGGINFVAVIGGITVLIAAGLAFVQDDVKKVLAYSTVSQLGYMVMALGCGAWTAAVFHLFTHAFFKALLFLGSGSLIHAVHSNNMSDMGGHEEVHADHVQDLPHRLDRPGRHPAARRLLVEGRDPQRRPREPLRAVPGGGPGRRLHDRGLHDPHLLPGVLRRVPGPRPPPRVAAVDAHPAGDPGRAVGAWSACSTPPASRSSTSGWCSRCRACPSSSTTTPSTRAGRHLHDRGPLGVGAAAGYYLRNTFPYGMVQKNGLARTGYKILVNKYYLDELFVNGIIRKIQYPIARAAYWVNQNVIDGVVNAFGTGSRKVADFVYDNIDQKVVDGLVNGAGAGSEAGGAALRRTQNGRVQSYAAYLFGAAALLAVGLVAFT